MIDRCEATREHRGETIRCDKRSGHKGPHSGPVSTAGRWRAAWLADDYDYSARWREALERTRA